ncbi:hypothetical protein [Roseateles oligotrophus]|uniref:Uncharacterized protein n=1 Tax=Roseateles oligotrophus TaxID=1769250 RepID=A0ABT2YCA3_9BURK|nr:hypothetical protein [Roseateles oligotrophus]MCV2367669.1 hypothetical protein [Roseateles oligotrophus]
MTELLPQAESVWRLEASGHGYLSGSTACLSTMYAAQQHEAPLALLVAAMAPYKMWHYRQWGVRALLVLGRKAEALQYAEDSRGLNAPDQLISQTCEEILLASGLIRDTAEAYTRYAVVGNQAGIYLAAFRAIAKKYPHKSAGRDPTRPGRQNAGQNRQEVCGAQVGGPVQRGDRAGRPFTHRFEHSHTRSARSRPGAVAIRARGSQSRAALDGPGLWLRHHRR